MTLTPALSLREREQKLPCSFLFVLVLVLVLLILIVLPHRSFSPWETTGTRVQKPKPIYCHLRTGLHFGRLPQLDAIPFGIHRPAEVTKFRLLRSLIHRHAVTAKLRQ